MYKALFFDIDGTLVSFATHTVPESTLQAIHQARLNGVKVFICTGRPLQFVNNLQGVEYDGMVCATGSLCLDGEGNTIFQKSIAKEDVERLLTLLSTNPIPFLAISKQHIYGFNTHQPVVSEVMASLNVQLPTLLPIEETTHDDILQLIGFFTAGKQGNGVISGCDICGIVIRRISLERLIFINVYIARAVKKNAPYVWRIEKTFVPLQPISQNRRKTLPN